MAFDWGSVEDWGAIADIGVKAYGAYAANQAADEEQQAIRDAAGSTSGASAAAIEELRRQSLQVRADLAPYNAAGQGALAAYMRAMGVRPVNLPATAGGFGSGSYGRSSFPGMPTGPSDKDKAEAKGAMYGKAAGTAIGSFFFGPVGGAVGGALGNYVGQRFGPYVDRYGTVAGPVAAGLKALPSPVSGFVNKFIGDGGDLATGSRVYHAVSNGNNVFYDANGNVIWRGATPTSGMTEIPGLSRNGNPIFLTSEGKMVKRQQSGGGFDDLNFSVGDYQNGSAPREVYNIIAKDYNPLIATAADYGVSPVEMQSTGFTQAGTEGGSAADSDPYGGFLTSPGYKFLFDETMRGARAQGSARGGLYSGRMLKELQDRAAGVASQDFGNYTDRLYRIATLGENAAAQTGSNAASTGANVANITTNQGDTLANLQLAAGQSRASSVANNAALIGQGVSALADYYGRRNATDTNESIWV